MNKKLLLILSSGLFFRILFAFQHQFWFDEAVSYYIAKLPLPSLLIATAADNHPPFYYLLLHFWLKIGNQPLFLRIPSLIFSFSCIPIIYLIGKRLFSKNTGLLAATIFAISPPAVYYSQETRMYTLAMFLNLSTFFFFLKMLKTNNISSKIGFFLSLLLGLYTHYYFVFAALFFNLLALFSPAAFKLNSRNWLKLQLLLLLLYLPWILLAITYPHPQNWRYPLWLAVPATFVSFAIGGLGAQNLKMILLDSDNFLIKAIAISLSALMFSVFLYGILALIKKYKIVKNHPYPFQLQSSLLIHLYLFFPLLAASLVSILAPVYSLRSLMIFSPFYYLAIANAIFKFRNSLVKKVTSLLLIISSVLITLSMNFNPYLWQEPLSMQFLRLKNNLKAGDVIAHINISTYLPFRYYQGNLFPQYLIMESGLSRETEHRINANFTSTDQILKQYRRIWIVDLNYIQLGNDISTFLNRSAPECRDIISMEIQGHLRIYLIDQNRNETCRL